MNWSLVLEVIGFTIGILYLWWEYHADPKVWIATIIKPAISMWIYLSKGIYADFAMDIYYLIIAVYGYWAWTHHKPTKDSKSKTLPISHTPVKAWAVIAAALLVLWSVLQWILRTFTNSLVPMTDAFTTSVSIIAMCMMARKYAEQWLAWMVVDIVNIGLYSYKGLIFYPILSCVYTVIAILGYRKWVRMIPKNDDILKQSV